MAAAPGQQAASMSAAADGFRGAQGVAHLWDLFRNEQIFEESEQRQISSTLVPELNHSLHTMHQAAWMLRKRVRDLHRFTAADMQAWGTEFRKFYKVRASVGCGVRGVSVELDCDFASSPCLFCLGAKGVGKANTECREREGEWHAV